MGSGRSTSSPGSSPHSSRRDDLEDAGDGGRSNGCEEGTWTSGLANLRFREPEVCCDEDVFERAFIADSDLMRGVDSSSGRNSSMSWSFISSDTLSCACTNWRRLGCRVLFLNVPIPKAEV